MKWLAELMNKHKVTPRVSLINKPGKLKAASRQVQGLSTVPLCRENRLTYHRNGSHYPSLLLTACHCCHCQLGRRGLVSHLYQIASGWNSAQGCGWLVLFFFLKHKIKLCQSGCGISLPLLYFQTLFIHFPNLNTNKILIFHWKSL